MNVAKAVQSVWLIVLCLALPCHAEETLTAEKHGFVGTFYPAADKSANKAVVVLGGSEGGIPEKLAQGVAALGVPTLAVAYFGAEGLPAELENIPLEYLASATKWLANKKGMREDALTLVGWSKGAELSLLLASRHPEIKTVVAIASSSVAWAGILNDWQKTPGASWTHNNTAIPYVPFRPTGPVSGLLDLYTQSLDNRNDEGQASIPVNNIKGDVYLFSGGKDEIWPSARMAESICEQMQLSSASSCTHYHYENLAHLLDYQFLDPATPMHRQFAAAIGADGS